MSLSRRTRLRSRIDQPTAEQRRWREAVRELGSIIDGSKPCEIHHCAGRTAKHQGVAIGHWWILPLTAEQHRGPQGVESWGRDRKGREKDLWVRVLIRMHERSLATQTPVPAWPPEDVRGAIFDFHR